MTRSSYRVAPDNPTGAPLNRCREWLEVVVPEATTNLFLNPSWETDTNNWTATSDGSTGTPYARGTTYQFKGAYSAVLTVRPTGGTFVQIVGPTVSTSTDYTISFHVRRPAGGEVRSADVRAVVNGTSTTFDQIVYVADGWWRCVKSYRATSTSAPGIRVQGSPGAIFYVDAAQLEQKLYPTTYCDGDQLGLLAVERLAPFYWNGTPHASTSSRSAYTRAGGRVVSVARYGLTILGLIGLGFGQRSVISTPLGLLDGSLYQRTVREARSFTVAGAFEGVDPRQVSARRGSLRALLSHDRTGEDSPLLIYLQRYQGGRAIGDRALLSVAYLEGLGEELGQVYDEKVSIQFQEFSPLLLTAADRGTTLTVQSSVSNANRVIQRGASGSWSALSTGLNGTANDMIVGRDGLLYVCGAFTTAGGGGANRIATWNGSAWAALGTGLGGLANDMAFGPNGTLYVVGAFTTAGGGGANRIASWNGSAWSALGTGFDNDAIAVAVGPTGIVYAGGVFTTAGGGAAAAIASWNGSAWSALGSGVNGQVNAIVVGPDGRIYVGGAFTLAGGGSANRIAVWNGSTWSTLGTGFNSDVRDLAFDAAGNLYATGDFTTADGVSAIRAAVWNGVAWAPLSTGLAGGTPTGTTVFNGPDGIYFGGAFTTAGGIPVPDGAAKWTGSSWTPIPIDLPGTATLSALAFGRDGTLYLGWDTGGTATVAGATAITNVGTGRAGFRLVINGPSSGTSRLYSLADQLGNTLYFDLAINAGEICTLVVDPESGISFGSNFRPSLLSSILPGSDYAEIGLVPGSNTLTIYLDSSTPTAVLSYTPRYESLDDLTRGPR